VERELIEAKRVAEKEKMEQEERDQRLPPGADPFSRPPPISSAMATTGTEKAGLIPNMPPQPTTSKENTTSNSNMKGPDPFSSQKPGLLNSIKNRLQRNSVVEGVGPSSLEVHKSGTHSGNTQATPTKDIQRNIKTAIAACRSENQSVLENRRQMTTVKESLEDGYCDVSGTDKDFEHIGRSQTFVLVGLSA